MIGYLVMLKNSYYFFRFDNDMVVLFGKKEFLPFKKIC